MKHLHYTQKTHSFPRIYTTTEHHYHHHPVPDLPQATTRPLGTDLPHPQHLWIFFFKPTTRLGIDLPHPQHLCIFFFFFKPTTRVVFDLYNSCCTTASMNAAVHRWVCKNE